VLSKNGGGFYSVSSSYAQEGVKSLQLGIAQYQGGQNDSWSQAKLAFPKLMSEGTIELYLRTQRNSPYYIYPRLVTESGEWQCGAWIVDYSNSISPGWFESLEQQSTADKIDGWLHFKWVVANGKVELWVGGKLIGRGPYKAPPAGVEIGMTSAVVSNVSTFIDNVKVTGF
jgi:hypothetical protein